MKKIILCLAFGGAIYFSNAQTWSTSLNIGSTLKLGTSSANNLIFYSGGHEGMSLTPAGVFKVNALSGSTNRMLYTDPSGNIQAMIGGGGSPGYPGPTDVACLATIKPWFLGGNYYPFDNTIGTCSPTDFILKSNSRPLMFITNYGYIGIGQGNSTPQSVVDISDGTISGNTSHMKIFGDPTGRIESSGDMTVVSNNNLSISASNNLNVNANAASFTSNGNLNLVYFNNLNGNGGNFSVYENTTSRFNILMGGNVGIGTSNPTTKLQISDPYSAHINAYTLGPNPAKLSVANQYLQYYFSTDNAIGHIGSTTNTTPADHPIFHFQTTGSPNYSPQVWIGTRPTTGTNTDFNLAVGGKIVAQSVYVTLQGTWADYVFANDYKLATLSEVESFYKANKHLPEIPSAKEVAEKGINVETMNVLLLKKIEELTLYVIAQQKEIEKLKQN